MKKYESKEADQDEKELMQSALIDIKTKKSIIDFRKWCKQFTTDIDVIIKELKNQI